MRATTHIQRGRCPKCGKFRTLDHTVFAPTVQDDRRRARADRPQRPTKPLRVCEECARRVIGDVDEQDMQHEPVGYR